MATIDKIRVSGVTYDIVDGSAVHSLDGYWTSGQTNDAITAATGALAETIAEQDYASKAYVQSAITEAGGTTTATVQTMIDESISGKADSSAVTEEISSAVSAATSGAVYNFSVIKQNGGNKLFYYLTKGTGDYPSQTIFEAGSGLTLDNNLVLKVDTSVIASKNDIPSVSGYADAVAYDSNSKEMKFYHGGTGGTEVFSFDASPFLIDGMVQNVEIKDVTISGESVTCLVISFNTDAGKQDINIPIEDIFDAANYYTKAEVDSQLSGITESLSGKADFSAATITTQESGTVTNTRYSGYFYLSFNYNDGVYSFSGHSSQWQSYIMEDGFSIAISDGTNTTYLNKSNTGDTSNYTFTTTFNDFVIETKGSYKVTSVDIQFDGTSRSVDYTYMYSKSSETAVSTAIENNVYPALESIETALNGKQNTLSAGTGIVISGDVISVTGVPNVDQTVISGSTNPVAGGAVYNELQGKQDTLVSGTSIKTVNNESVLGSGNIATLQAEVSGTTLIFS